MHLIKKAHRILALETTKAYNRYVFCLKIKNNDKNDPEVIYAKAIWVGFKLSKEKIKKIINETN